MRYVSLWRYYLSDPYPGTPQQCYPRSDAPTRPHACTQNDVRCATILSMPAQIEANTMPQDIVDEICSLWCNSAVQEAVHHACEFHWTIQLSTTSISSNACPNPLTCLYPFFPGPLADPGRNNRTTWQSFLQISLQGKTNFLENRVSD
jgi:hypothetical protein